MTKQLYLNGIDADTGGPLDGDQPITTAMIAKVARGQRLSPEDLRDAKLRKNWDMQKSPDFGISEGLDDTDLGSSGWALIFPAALPQKSVAAIKDALKPLLDLRKEQAAAQKEYYYKEVTGSELGYKNGETKNDFLKRFGRGPGPADPEKFPYYALIVGSPETIPFTFQYQLDVQYAVGRIYFNDLEDYYRYASSVVAAEKKQLSRARRAAFFGVANQDDRATAMSSGGLIRPLAQQMQAQYGDWSVDLVAPEQATKANLSNYLGGAQTPALFFSASHGMSFKPNDARLLPHTGAIVTQDWPGPGRREPVTDQFYFSADDIASDADVSGMLAFIFACYGGGMPQKDNFYQQIHAEPKDIAPYAFVAQLPLKLLAHPRGGALGVFAHVERAWGSSIEWEGLKNDVVTFNSTVAALLNGKPAGAAGEYFNERYGEISTMLTEELDTSNPENQDEIKLAGLWTSNNDARNYTFIGDPAVRLAVSDRKTAAPVSGIPLVVSAAAQGFQPDVVERGAAVTAPVPGADTNYNIIGDILKKSNAPGGTPTVPVANGGSLNESLQKLMEKLGNYLSAALDDATSLEVSTYAAEDLGSVEYKAGKFSGAALRAMTRINIDGDTLVCVPEKDGEVDLALWNIHLEMVKAAQANRAELLKTIVSAATGIANTLK